MPTNPPPPPPPEATRPDAICPHCGRYTPIPTSFPDDQFTCRGCLCEVQLAKRDTQAISSPVRWGLRAKRTAIWVIPLVLALVVILGTMLVVFW